MATLVDPREKVEKGRSSLGTPGDRFAYWLSQTTSPFVVGLGVFGYVALSTASTVPDDLRWLTVIGVGLLVPFGWICWGVKTGKWTDIHVSRRSERLVRLLVGLMALTAMLAGLLGLSASRPLVATLVAIICGEGSMPHTRPVSPTRCRACIASVPGPHPTSSTLSPGCGRARSAILCRNACSRPRVTNPIKRS